MRGCQLLQPLSYLDKFMWRDRYETVESSALDVSIEDIAAQYSINLYNLILFRNKLIHTTPAIFRNNVSTPRIWSHLEVTYPAIIKVT